MTAIAHAYAKGLLTTLALIAPFWLAFYFPLMLRLALGLLSGGH